MSVCFFILSFFNRWHKQTALMYHLITYYDRHYVSVWLPMLTEDIKLENPF